MYKDQQRHTRTNKLGALKHDDEINNWRCSTNLEDGSFQWFIERWKLREVDAH